ncbi:MAG: NAD(P)H-dependent oxidoreductase [Anaerolineaceae bacterium]|nr:NAD(P)H-dependent oxidoreductase [Anaerolineaceae bacterium]
MKLLHIIATPRTEQSNTMRIATAYLEAMCANHVDLSVETVNLFLHDLPAIDGENIEIKYTLMAHRPIDKHHQASWRQIESLIEQFLAADMYLISTPMWNLSIPYMLKYYIDAIVQPGYLFNYTKQGPMGLVQGKKMICITTHGSDYSQGPFQAFNFLEPYLRAIFGFVGVTDIEFVSAQPMDSSVEQREAAIATAIARVRQLAAGPALELATADYTEAIRV